MNIERLFQPAQWGLWSRKPQPNALRRQAIEFTAYRVASRHGGNRQTKINVSLDFTANTVTFWEDDRPHIKGLKAILPIEKLLIETEDNLMDILRNEFYADHDRQRGVEGTWK